MHAKIDGSLFEEKSLFWDSYIISLYIYVYMYINNGYSWNSCINILPGKVTQSQGLNNDI